MKRWKILYLVIGIFSVSLVAGCSIKDNSAMNNNTPAPTNDTSVIQKESDLLKFYENIFDDIYKEDDGLNSDMKLIALDMTKVQNLNEVQKKSIVDYVKNKYSVETRQATYEELCKEGLIDQKNLYFKSGILVDISDSEIKNDKFSFNIKKWRSGDGAVGHDNCDAEYKNGKWSYQFKSSWIS